MAVEAGTRLGRYLIHEYLGQGNLGLVYRACAPDGSSVAVKILRELAGAQDRERFLAYGMRMREALHPNLGVVLEFGQHEGVPYLVMPFVSEGSLAARL